MRGLFRWGRNALVLIIGSAALGTVLLVLACSIPQEALETHVRDAVDILLDEGTYPSIFSGTSGTKLDNFTDGLMINTAYTSTGNALYDALQATQTRFEGTRALESLNRYFASGSDGSYVQTYGRYWHGYLIFLRPLLALVSYPSIRALNMVGQLALMFVLLSVLMWRGKATLFVPLFAMWICLSPATLFNSLQYSSVFYSTMLCAIVLVGAHDRLDVQGRCVVFETCGVLVAYFDLLTYPLVSLGVPLVLFFSLDYGQPRSWRERVGQLLVYAVSWGVGYGGMWASKWMIGSVLTGENVVSDALDAVTFRTSSSYGTTEYTWFGVIASNLGQLKSAAVVSAVGLSMAVGAALLVVRQRVSVNPPAFAAIVVAACLPFLWYLVVMNHSAIHYWMTYRELAITVYSAVSLPIVHVGRGRGDRLGSEEAAR